MAINWFVDVKCPKNNMRNKVNQIEVNEICLNCPYRIWEKPKPVITCNMKSMCGIQAGNNSIVSEFDFLVRMMTEEIDFMRGAGHAEKKLRILGHRTPSRVNVFAICSLSDKSDKIYQSRVPIFSSQIKNSFAWNIHEPIMNISG